METTQLIGPLVLFFLMAVVGLELTRDDFRRVLAEPRAVLGATGAQIVLLPIWTWCVVRALDISPVFGAGAVLIALAPGAGISNILTALAGANTALSVTLTAVASLLAALTLPTLAAASMGLFLGEAMAVEVPAALLFAQLCFALLLPIALGMWLRARRPEWVQRSRRRLQRIAMAGIGLLTLAGFASGGGESTAFGLAELREGLLAAGVWTLGAMALGWGVAFALRLPEADRFTCLIEFSTRNVAVAAIVALSGLQRLDLALFSVTYLLIGYPLAFGAVAWRRRRNSA